MASTYTEIGTELMTTGENAGNWGTKTNTNIKIIEDCAQAQGAKFKNKYVGTFGDAGCFSFYPTKILGAYGDGGFISTNSMKLCKKMKRNRYNKLRWKVREDNIAAIKFYSKSENYKSLLKGDIGENLLAKYTAKGLFVYDDVISTVFYVIRNKSKKSFDKESNSINQ